MATHDKTMRGDVTGARAEPLIMPLPSGMARMESGPLQVGDDWPGYFLRGDHALHLAGLLRGAAADLEAYNPLRADWLRAAADDIERCKA